jgi:Glycosyl transferase family 90
MPPLTRVTFWPLGGGTTWQGTLTKLRMPGVLFHHETPAKDWFFDLMKPWEHFIPVQTDLGDLWARYLWAERHPGAVMKIAEKSSKLADYILSGDYLEKVYQEFFINYLGKVVDAYQPRGNSWSECLAKYQQHGIALHLISECGRTTCNSAWKEGTTIHFRHHVKPSSLE